MVAQKLKQSPPQVLQQTEEHPIKEAEVITPEVVILDLGCSAAERQPILECNNKRKNSAAANCYVNSEYNPDEILSNSSSLGSWRHESRDEEAGCSNESIQTIAQEMGNATKYKFEVFEPETPGRAVSSTFIVMFSLLGMTIITMIILTVVFNYGLLLMLVMIVIVFMLIVILTHFCAMMYQI